MRKISDRVMLGLISGGWLPKEAINYVSNRSNLEQVRYPEMVAGLFLDKKRTKSRSGIWFGIGADFAVSSLLGIPLAYLLSKSGKDYAPIKGVVMAISGFGTFRGIVANLGPNKVYPSGAKTNAAMSVSSIIWGLVAGTVMRAIADDTVFSNAGVTRKDHSSTAELRTNKDGLVSVVD